MFETLSERLKRTLDAVRGQARLTEDNIKNALRDVRMALLEADVALPVVREFIHQVRERAIGQEVARSLNPGQTFIKIVHEQLIQIMGQAEELNSKGRPAVMLMVGLQGSGKTTSTAKLARWLREKQRKKVMVVSCDVYRPAAIEQLKTLAAQVNVTCFASAANQLPLHIAQNALAEAKQLEYDVLLVDTAGRLHIDAELMAEVQALQNALQPTETLFVVDSMTGQDAVHSAKAFQDALPLTGVILTKTDGDARGGAALSLRMITGKPIKFIGVGEKTAALEPYQPERLASRILGMGDVLSLIEELETKVDRQQAQKMLAKATQGKGFNLEDFRQQMEEMLKLGGMTELLAKMPSMGQIPQSVKEQASDKQIKRLIAIINSMTPQERRFPQIIKGSRKRRIAAGSGTQVQEVNRLLKQFEQTQKMMKKGGFAKLLKAFQGQFPGGRGGLPF